MQINLSKKEIVEFARRRDKDISKDDAEKESEVTKRLCEASKRGYMTQDDLVAVAKWKWRGGRTRQLAAENTDGEVREITTAAFSAKSERLRIGALLALRGVGWPMASVILHFAFPEKYPILDVRAMNTVGGSTLYTFERWMSYVRLCRDTARKHDVSLRTLDKALWAADRAAG